MLRAWSAGWRAALIAGVAGGLMVAAFAPFGAWPLAGLALAVLFALFRFAPSAGAAAAQGYAFGLGLNLVGVSWVYVSLHDVGGMPAAMAVVAVVGFSAYLACYPALAGWLTARFGGDGWGRFVLLAAAAWTASEWLKSSVFTGFPWLNVAYSQVANPALTGYAPLLGALGVSFAAAAWAALAVAFVAERRGPRARVGAALVVIPLGGLLLAAFDWSVPEGPPISVALLQGNVPQKLKWREGERENALENYATLTEAAQARLIVLPETALPMLQDYLPEGYLPRLAHHARSQAGDVVVGVVTRSFRDNGYDLHNSAVTVGSAPPQRYSKSHLVPFGEFVPPLFGWVYRWLNMPMSGFSRGARGAPPLTLAGTRVALNICYEDAFGDEIIAALPEARVLVNLTNVAWFGRSIAAAQHLQFSQLRAIETARYMLRATNTGVTAIIDARGRVVSELPQFTRGMLKGAFVPLQGMTPYARWGDLPMLLLCAGLLAGLGWHASRLPRPPASAVRRG